MKQQSNLNVHGPAAILYGALLRKKLADQGTQPPPALRPAESKPKHKRRRKK